MSLADRHTRPKDVQRALMLYALTVVVLNCLAWISYRAAGKPPLRRPLFELSDRYADLLAYGPKISHLEQGATPLAKGLPVYNYPAPAAYVYAFFLRSFRNPIHAYVALLALALAAAALLAWRAGRSARGTNVLLLVALGTTALLGSPLVFAVDRGNLEGVVGVVLGIGLVLFALSRFYSAAFFIGLAASIKPFPGLFLLLLLRRKLYPAFALGIVVAFLSIFAALTALGPTPLTAYRNLKPGVKTYFDQYMMKVPVPQEGRFDHSLMDAVKLLVNQANRHAVRHSRSPSSTFLPQNEFDRTPTGLVARPATELQMKHMYTVFVVSMAVAAGGLVYTALAVFRLPTLNQMILIGTAITLFPPLAAEYTLIHLYVPFGFFVLFLDRDVGAGNTDFKQSHMFGFLILFSLLFSPLSFFATKAGLVKTMLLIVLLWASGRFPMPSSLFGTALLQSPL